MGLLLSFGATFYLVLVLVSFHFWILTIKSIFYKIYPKFWRNLSIFLMVISIVMYPLSWWFSWVNIGMSTLLVMLVTFGVVLAKIAKQAPLDIPEKVILPKKKQPIDTTQIQRLEQQAFYLWNNAQELHQDEAFWTKYEQLLEKMRDLK